MSKKAYAENDLDALVLAELYDIGIAITSNLDIASILELVAERACNVLGADRAVCHLYDQESNRFALSTDLGKQLAPKLDRVPRPDGPTAYIVRTGQALISNDAQNEITPYRDSPFTLAEKVESVIGLPLKKGKEIVGVLYINFRRKGAVNQSVKRIAELIANQAAIAIYNARLFQLLAPREENMHNLVMAGHDIAESIAKGGQNQSNPVVKIVLDETAKSACHILEADCATIYPFDATREEYYNIGMEGTWGLLMPLNLNDKPRTQGGMAARVTKEEVLIVNDITLEPTAVKESKFLNREGIKAFVGTVVRTKETHLAVLYVSFRSPHFFSQLEVQTIRLFANQAGVLLQGARLLEKEQNARANLEMLALLNKIGSALSHRVIGIIGTTPVETKMIRAYLNQINIQNPDIDYSLDRIDSDITTLKELAASLKKLPELMGSPEPINVNEMIFQIIESIRHSYQNIQVNETYDPALPIINVPIKQIKEVFLNITRNAIEHMSSTGKLTIETCRLETGHEIEVKISDTGPGIDQNKQQKIFELFYSEKKGGLGFGLWWSRTFMRKIGGEILVESEIDRGSTFSVIIPIEALSFRHLEVEN